MSEKSIQVRLIQQHDYRFDIAFGGDVPMLTSDEPAPLGTGLGPSPVQLLSAAVGNCLSDSLLFALRKFNQAPEPIHCVVTSEVGRNADKRLRVLGMHAVLTFGVPADSLEHLDRVLDTFETYCTVTQSVGQGIPVTIQVLDSQGHILK
ncbi:peroxiredoxin [Limnohabitans sp. T6-5]|uniref:OsmC family protein n=1 Tax=Limnohabitans sp. T6-5 TaxID=1100724 RepID=UPI000D34E7D9|nr:OsmC family protein [Limnohabitans sp. T6-5]PUE11537.1 peroxiredoxin [Limnohabitans sp. T6-5]